MFLYNLDLRNFITFKSFINKKNLKLREIKYLALDSPVFDSCKCDRKPQKIPEEEGEFNLSHHPLWWRGLGGGTEDEEPKMRYCP